MPSCFVANCKNSTRKRIPGITFHKIPTKYSQQWLSAINRPADTYLPHKTVCSAHFSANDFYHNYGERKRLKDGAIPSIGTMKSINETSMESESMDPLTVDTDSTRLPEQCTPREEAVALKSSANSENNSIDRAETLKKDDFGKICRCCLSHETMANIFYLKYEEILFVDIFFKLLGTQVNSSDGLPENICGACIAALINFHNFQKKCHNSLVALLSASRENQDIKVQMPDVNISENELYEESLNENLNNNDYIETQKPETNISDDPNNEELCMVENESSPQLEDDTKNLDINISEDELDEEFQYDSNDKENIKNGVNNNESTAFPLPKKKKQSFILPRFCKSCKTWIITKEHECPNNTKGSFPCETCGKRFLHNASLQVHYRIHKLKLLVNQIRDEKGVTNPITDTTREKRMLTCSCGKIFYSSRSLARHKTENNHLDSLDTHCEICKKVVPSRRLNKHMQTAHNSKDERVVCSTCGKILKNRQCLRNHLKIHGEKKFLCSYCGKRFLMAASFKMHCLSHTGEKPFTCNLCGRKFRTSRNLSQHMDVHTGRKSYVCKFCSKAFRQVHHLKVHLRTHTGEKPFSCPYCDKTFAHNPTRIQHIRTHTGEKPYTCDTCKKSFRTKAPMIVHRRLHTGETPYLCDHCGETFSTRNTYRNHLAENHQEKKISCGLCDMKFGRLIDYKHHKRVQHTEQKPYTCKICSKDFRQKAHLASHMRTHTGEKPFGCPYCDKTFAHLTTRIVHVRSHTGERPYVCDVCSKGFHHSSTMNKHRQTHFKNLSSKSADCEASD